MAEWAGTTVKQTSDYMFAGGDVSKGGTGSVRVDWGMKRASFDEIGLVVINLQKRGGHGGHGGP